MRQFRRPAHVSTVQHNLIDISKLQNVPSNSEIVKRYITDRYAEAVICDPANFDAIEIHDNSEFRDSTGDVCYEPCCDQYSPSGYCVYVHLVEGGIDCCGDFTRREDAQAYGKDISEKYSWPVNDFSASEIHTESSLRRQKALFEKVIPLWIGFHYALSSLDPYDQEYCSDALLLQNIYKAGFAEIDRRLSEK
jgi:hypothetical protein